MVERIKFFQLSQILVYSFECHFLLNWCFQNGHLFKSAWCLPLQLRYLKEWGHGSPFFISNLRGLVLLLALIQNGNDIPRDEAYCTSYILLLECGKHLPYGPTSNSSCIIVVVTPHWNSTCSMLTLAKLSIGYLVVEITRELNKEPSLYCSFIYINTMWSILQQYLLALMSMHCSHVLLLIHNKATMPYTCALMSYS